jgi:hypothetical protein
VTVARERVDDVRRVLRRDVPARHRRPGVARKLATEFRPNEGVLAVARVDEPGSLLAVTNQRVIHVPHHGEVRTWEIRDLSTSTLLPCDLPVSAHDRERLLAAVRSTVLWHTRASRPRRVPATTPLELTELLRLPRDASDDAIRDAYRVLSQIFHPDRHAGAPVAVRDEAARRMRDLNVAYSAWRARSAA